MPILSQSRDFKTAKKKAFDLLSRRDHSIFEVKHKLKEKGFSEAICMEVVSYLEKIDLLNDHKFIRQWSRFRLDLHGFGPIRLRRELREKGLPTDEVDLFVNTLSDEWSPEILAETVLLRRYKDLMLLQTPKNRRRAFDFLQRKGHSKTVIFAVFKKLDIM